MIFTDVTELAQQCLEKETLVVILLKHILIYVLAVVTLNSSGQSF